MSKRVLRIKLGELVMFVCLLPVGIGTVAACRGTAAYLEAVTFHEPLRNIHRAIASAVIESQNFLCTVFFACILVAIDNGFGWILSGIAISYFAFVRSRIARLFGVVLLVAVPLIDLILALPLNGQKIWLLMARCITSAGVLIGFTAVLLAICRFRPLSNEHGLSGQRDSTVWRWVATIVVVAVTLVVSSFGWRGLRILFS